MASTRSVISPGIFAEDATTTIPPVPIQGVSYRDPVAGPASAADGWPFFEKVNSAEFNQLLFQYSSLVDIMDKQGVLGWTSLKDYQAAALVYGSNGLLYFWLQESGPGTAAGIKDPVTEPTYWQQFAAHGMLSFTTAGVTNWTVPLAMKLGIIKPKVRIGGGGASGARRSAQSGGGGGGGGEAESVIDLTGVTSVAITIGAGGASPASDAAGNAGGASSFGAFMSATGGLAIGGSSFGGSEGGIGSGGTINKKGGGGGAAKQGITGASYVGGFGGASPLSGGAPESHASVLTAGNAGQLGAGGSGGILNGTAGPGGAGYCIIEW